VKKAEAATQELANEYLDRVAARIQERPFSIITKIKKGRPHEEIIRFADTEQVDLIVMCSRGYSGISRWLMGSVSDRVIRGASKPVLLIRPEEDHDL
jgi:nucleotide-binding universal stress UspA family protein